MAIDISWVSLGRMEYDEALSTQLTQATRLLEGESDTQTVYAVEHPRTITIGRNGTRDNILLTDDVLAAEGFAVRAVDRGGDVTYHGPGQLVVYPVLHLGPWQNDVSLYVRHLEEVVIQALANVGIVADRHAEYPGVWVANDKICAVGARVKRRADGEYVTYHGIALNVHTQLDDFDAIVPCGISDKGVTSVERLLGVPQSLVDWEDRVQRSFMQVFDTCDV